MSALAVVAKRSFVIAYSVVSYAGVGGGSVDVYPDIGEISSGELVAGHLGVAFQAAVAYRVVTYPGTLGPAGEVFPVRWTAG